MKESYAGHAPMELTTVLKTDLHVNDAVIPLNRFTQCYIGNILRGMVSSLGYTGRKVIININSGELKMYADDVEVPVKKEFVKLLIVSTIKGMLSPLNGIFWLERITITTE